MSLLGGLISISIPAYVTIGIILIILGLVIASFLPFVKFQGFIIFISGLLMIVLGDKISALVQNQTFQIIAIFLFAFLLSFFVLFSGLKNNNGGRKK